MLEALSFAHKTLLTMFCNGLVNGLEAKSLGPNLFWFNDELWARIVPHLPANQPGPEF